ncbi:hypothetical protein [Liberiplasma polymorphum]|uniref:hypothetical protein n=1 Tax=Liberiplasma polymorphum TaxID=3374570 RepID=UPI003772D49A
MNDYEFNFNGVLLNKGFWIYCYKITTRENQLFYYIGRTGDNKEFQVGSPLKRLFAHFGDNKNSNALKTNMIKNDLSLEDCDYHFYAFGPYFGFPNTKEEHIHSRDYVSTIEKLLAEKLKESGFNVLGTHQMRNPFKMDNIFNEINRIFAKIT